MLADFQNCFTDGKQTKFSTKQVEKFSPHLAARRLKILIAINLAIKNFNLS